jgi:hypothetical protein
MQNSELYRRGFVVPLNKEAELALINNNVNEQTDVDFFEIPSDQVFESLWTKGFFKKINEDLDLMIDDYEEEIVENFKINKLNEMLKEFKDKTRLDSEETTVIVALERLLSVAMLKKSSVFFIM